MWAVAAPPSSTRYAWGAGLAVLTGSGQLVQHIRIQVALHIQSCQVVLIEFVQAGDDFLQHLGRGDEEHGVAYIVGKGGIFLPSFESSAISTSSP